MPVFLGALMKNIAPQFAVFEDCLRNLQDRIPDMKICLYEDGSTDGTKEMLATFKRHNPDIHVRSETVDWHAKSRIRTWDNKPCRIECIAEARNQLMRMLEFRGMGERDDDVVIFMDADIPVLFPLDRVVQLATRFPEGVDGVFANGVARSSGRYYDLFAHRDMTDPFDLDVLGEREGMPVFQQKTRRVTQQIAEAKTLVPVLSAFGGLGIYRGKSIVHKRYSAFPTTELDTFYQQCMQQASPLVNKLLQVQGKIETHKDGCLLGMYLHRSKETGGLFYWNCWGYNWPIVCEHVTFHMAMRSDGKDKLFVDPSLRLVSGH
jgi:hypothetical protein